MMMSMLTSKDVFKAASLYTEELEVAESNDMVIRGKNKCQKES